MTWLPEEADGATPLDRVFGLRADAYAGFRALYARLWDPPHVDPVALELCRLRIGMLLGCGAECAVRNEVARRAGLVEEQVDALADWPTSPLFTSRQRACLAFAEQYILDPQAFRDADVARLRDDVGPAGLAALTLGVAVFDALVRFRLALEVDIAPPARATVAADGVPPSLP